MRMSGSGAPALRATCRSLAPEVAEVAEVPPDRPDAPQDAASAGGQTGAQQLRWPGLSKTPKVRSILRNR